MTVAFMTLLRHMLPELYSFLEEEQSCGGAWLASTHGSTAGMQPSRHAWAERGA